MGEVAICPNYLFVIPNAQLVKKAKDWLQANAIDFQERDKKLVIQL